MAAVGADEGSKAIFRVTTEEHFFYFLNSFRSEFMRVERFKEDPVVISF
jgi:hypothetical protein